MKAKLERLASNQHRHFATQRHLFVFAGEKPHYARLFEPYMDTPDVLEARQRGPRDGTMLADLIHTIGTKHAMA